MISIQYRFDIVVICKVSVKSSRFLKQFLTILQEVFYEIEKYWKVLSEDEEVKKLQFSEWTTAYMTDTAFYYTTGKRAYSLANYFNSLIKDEQKKIKNPKSILQESKDYNNSLKMLLKSGLFFLMIPGFIRHYVPVLSHYNKNFLDNVKWFENKNLEFIKERKEEIKNTENNEELSPNTLTLLLTTNTERDLNKISKGEFSRALTDVEIAAFFKEIFGGGIETVRNIIEKKFSKKNFLINTMKYIFFFF